MSALTAYLAWLIKKLVEWIFAFVSLYMLAACKPVGALLCFALAAFLAWDTSRLGAPGEGSDAR